MEWMQIVAERQIQAAMDDGQFDDLPGKGQPLHLDEDLSIPAHQRIAARILKNARALPDWIQTERDIERERDGAVSRRENGLKALARVHDADRFQRQAVRLRADLRDRMGLVNTLILKVNQIAPKGYQKIYAPFALAKELESLDAQIAALDRERERAAAAPVPPPRARGFWRKKP